MRERDGERDRETSWRREIHGGTPEIVSSSSSSEQSPSISFRRFICAVWTPNGGFHWAVVEN